MTTNIIIIIIIIIIRAFTYGDTVSVDYEMHATGIVKKLVKKVWKSQQESIQ